MASRSRAVLITTAASADRVRPEKAGHKKRKDVWFHRFQGCFYQHHHVGKMSSPRFVPSRLAR